MTKEEKIARYSKLNQEVVPGKIAMANKAVHVGVQRVALEAGIRVAVVDCDYPQHSILKLSNRDKAVVQSSAIYGRLLVSLAENKGVKPYRILCCKPSEAMSEWRKWAAVAEERYDVVLFDLPGTVGNEGVLSTIVELDYLFIPMKADRIVLESTLNFASVLNDRLIKTGRAHLRELFLF